MKIMITGAAGFIGGRLTTYCAEAGYSVLGLDTHEAPDGWAGSAFEQADIQDPGRVGQVLSTFRPDRIFHLAAQSYPTVSLLKPRETMDSNVGGTVNLYECLRTASLSPIIVVACSSAEYGPVAPADLPVRETHPLHPVHPYGVSKVAQDLLAAQYFLNYGIPCVRIRIFNTTGPGKVGDLCSDLTKRAAEIEMGMRPPSLPAGNLTTRRALVDVRDMVRALWLAGERCEHGEVYNVGGNQICSGQDIIDMIRTRSTLGFTVEQDPTLLRVCDEPVIAGDISKFRTCSGWAPEIPMIQTVQDTLDWWRARLQSPSARVTGA
jgi:GDP-4-dehydro-6-deoxy-D-mannose reductase